MSRQFFDVEVTKTEKQEFYVCDREGCAERFPVSAYHPSARITRMTEFGRDVKRFCSAACEREALRVQPASVWLLERTAAEAPFLFEGVFASVTDAVRVVAHWYPNVRGFSDWARLSGTHYNATADLGYMPPFALRLREVPVTGGLYADE